jgi:tRNA1Val (adenine37-N6)-methyltransferase
MSKEKIAENKPFIFKQFSILQDRCAMKVGTDGVLLGAWANTESAKNILDIGAGTGVIALMLAQRSQNTEGVKIHAVEIDATAAEQAQENFKAAPFSERLAAFALPIQDFARKATERYDLIVSNPPFFTGGTLNSNGDKTNVRHTVKLPHSDLLNATRALLAKNGRFCVILPLLEGMRFVEVAATYGLSLTQRTDVRFKKEKPIERLLLAFENQAQPLQHDELILQHSTTGDRDFTEAYKELTKDFYTIF